jgi:hypothetical protein
MSIVIIAIRKLDRDTLKLYTALELDQEHAINLGPPGNLQPTGGQ